MLDCDHLGVPLETGDRQLTYKTAVIRYKFANMSREVEALQSWIEVSNDDSTSRHGLEIYFFIVLCARGLLPQRLHRDEVKPGQVF